MSCPKKARRPPGELPYRGWAQPTRREWKDTKDNPMEQITARLMNWASILDGQTRAQAETTAAMPFVFPHVALMPDAHLGKGATVGSVIPTLGAIIPAAIGVDIGCGVIAVRTQFTEDDLPADRRAVRELIERAIPLSGGARNTTIR